MSAFLFDSQAQVGRITGFRCRIRPAHIHVASFNVTSFDTLPVGFVGGLARPPLEPGQRGRGGSCASRLPLRLLLLQVQTPLLLEQQILLEFPFGLPNTRLLLLPNPLGLGLRPHLGQLVPAEGLLAAGFEPPLIEFEPLLDQLQPGIGQHELRRVPGGAERHRGGLIELQVQFQSPVE
ncbi:MAG: hypothetical protein KDA79_03040 [Planctomycetaceae bacterium]|nr:hypothetical protein [Planctomycetaceae bacterium]